MTHTGGAGRIINTTVDSMPAVVGIIADADFAALLADQDMTVLLATDSIIQYGTANGAATSTIHPNTNPTGILNVTTGSRRLGTLNFPQLVTGTGLSTVVYIDDHAPVAVAYQRDNTAKVEVVTIGGPITSSLPTGRASYAGYAVVNSREPQSTGGQALGSGATFAMDVNFDMGKVTRFHTVISDQFGTYGTVTTEAATGLTAITNIDINAGAGTFAGDINFIESELAFFDLIPETSGGKIYGQFHGDDAIGVTGLYHNTANNVIGGFAGSKQP